VSPGAAAGAPAEGGIIVVDKPSGWTSHDVVGRLRRLAGTRKVGHAGTLDPMATGVLVLGIGRGTRLLTFLVGSDKDYSATIRLGQATATDDADGEVAMASGAAGVGDEQVDRAVRALTGTIAQVPSAVSAIKVDGRRAYARARSGEEVTLAARPVTVSRFVVVGRSDGRVDDVPVVDLEVEVTVSSGTYVRALARDLGAALGCGGHLTALRRTRVGALGEEAAHTLEELAAVVDDGDGLPLLSLATVARRSFPVRELAEDEARALGFGGRIESAVPGRTEPVAAVGPDGRLIAMLDEGGARTRSHVVFAPATS
jgi:tRNA pseudouridine55 synthase